MKMAFGKLKINCKAQTYNLAQSTDQKPCKDPLNQIDQTTDTTQKKPEYTYLKF
jgi:hypothetical protein